MFIKKRQLLENRTLMEFEDFRPIVSSYLREVRERQKEIGGPS
jgi:hypothetical protein